MVDVENMVMLDMIGNEIEELVKPLRLDSKH